MITQEVIYKEFAAYREQQKELMTQHDIAIIYNAFKAGILISERYKDESNSCDG